MNKRDFIKKYKAELEEKLGAGDYEHPVSVLYDMMKDFFSSQAKANAADGSDVQAVIATYCEAWKQRYQAQVQITPIMVRKAKEMTSKLGKESACRAVQHYLRRDDAFYMRTRHPLEYAAKDAEMLHLESTREQAGVTQQVLTADASKLHERMSANRSTIEQYLNREGLDE